MAQSRTSAPNDWREEAAAYLRSRGGHGSSSDAVNFEECGGDDSVFGSTVAEATAALPFVREGKERRRLPAASTSRCRRVKPRPRSRAAEKGPSRRPSSSPRSSSAATLETFRVAESETWPPSEIEVSRRRKSSVFQPPEGTGAAAGNVNSGNSLSVADDDEARSPFESVTAQDLPVAAAGNGGKHGRNEHTEESAVLLVGLEIDSGKDASFAAAADNAVFSPFEEEHAIGRRDAVARGQRAGRLRGERPTRRR